MWEAKRGCSVLQCQLGTILPPGNHLSGGCWTSVGQNHWWLGNSGNRSLGASLAHIEGSTYLGPRKPIAAQRSHANSINLDARPSELLALGASVSQAGPHALL